MSSAIVPFKSVTENIEKILQDCNVVALKEMSGLTQAVTLATGIQQLKAALTDEVMNKVFMPLQGSTLGFLTDKDHPPKEWKDWTPEQKKNWSPGYSIPVVRDVIVEALINGFRPVNNEINIIARRMYGAKNGLQRKLSEFDGLTDLIITPGAPVYGGDKQDARVAIHASWKINGTPMNMIRDVEKRPDGTASDTRFAIRVNYGMDASAVIGKAIARTYKAILDRLTGSTLSFAVGEVLDVEGEIIASPAPVPAPPEQDGRRMDLGRRPTPPSIPSEPPPAPPKSEPKAGSPPPPPPPPPADKPRRMREPGEDD